jgi:hypothetical protein
VSADAPELTTHRPAREPHQAKWFKIGIDQSSQGV